MNATVQEPRGWSPARRWTLIAVVFAAHLGLIFALSDRKPVTPRAPAPRLQVSLVPEPGALLALMDPTLFALPQRRGYAGAGWLEIPQLQFQPFRWTEPPRFLALRGEALGGAFAQFMRTNRFASLAFETKPAPELPPPVAPEIGVPPPGNSVLHVAGELANRRLLNPSELPSWPAPDLLTNTVVQVVVKADGSVFSRDLLSGSFDPTGDPRARKVAEEADQSALDTARAARFEPLGGEPQALTIGVLIFEWRTVPLTNAPASKP